MSLSACNGMFEGIYDDPIESEMEIKESSFSQINTTEYTNWVYIDLSERKATTVEIGEEHKSEIPAEWDLAIHRYDIKTNEGAAYQTTYTNIDELKASGKASFIIALCGVIVPLIGGYGVAWFFNRPSMAGSNLSSPVVLQNVFIGVVLTATSVSITVETLKELGALKSRSGNAILGAAIIDDVLGIIALTIVTSLADDSVKIGMVLIKIVGFFVFSGVVGFVFYKMYKKWVDGAEKELHRHTIIAFVFCLLMAFIAEEVFGVADITGAYIAGLIISNVQRSTYLESKFDTLSYLLLSPVFFASIGLKVNLPQMSVSIIMFAVVLTVVAVLTKIIGCGLGAKICGYKNYQAKRIGVGMISRGEVALIVASKGSALGLMSSSILGPVIVVVVITTVITPILLKVVFAPGTGPSTQVEDAKTVTSYYENREDNR